VTTRGCWPRTDRLVHPLCTPPRCRPKPSPRRHVGRAPSRRSDRSFPPLDPTSPGAIRRPHATGRIELTLALRDVPKTAADASVTLKWTVPPLGVLFDSMAAANFPCNGRSRTTFHRRTPSSSRRTRGWRPQVIESLRHGSGTEPKLDPSAALERGALGPPCSRRRRRWAGISKDPAPRRGIPLPLRSAFAVSHDLGGLLLSAPSDVFQSVTLMEFGFRCCSTRWRFPEACRSEDPRVSRSPLGAPCLIGPRIAEAVLSPTPPRQAGKLIHGFPEGFDPSGRPGPLTPSAVASDSTGAAIPGVWRHGSSGPRSARCHADRPATVAV
jgi:hypothetical protein